MQRTVVRKIHKIHVTFVSHTYDLINVRLVTIADYSTLALTYIRSELYGLLIGLRFSSAAYLSAYVSVRFVRPTSSFGWYLDTSYFFLRMVSGYVLLLPSDGIYGVLF